METVALKKKKITRFKIKLRLNSFDGVECYSWVDWIPNVTKNLFMSLIVMLGSVNKIIIRLGQYASQCAMSSVSHNNYNT